MHSSESPLALLQKKKAQDLLPPVVNKHRHLQSVDLDPPFNDYQASSPLYARIEASHYRVGNRKNVESDGMSRALGFVGANRYSNQELYREPSLQKLQQSPRGPVPSGYLSKAPSLPSILSDAERKCVQYEEALKRGLRQVYCENRRKELLHYRY